MEIKITILISQKKKKNNEPSRKFFITFPKAVSDVLIKIVSSNLCPSVRLLAILSLPAKSTN